MTRDDVDESLDPGNYAIDGSGWEDEEARSPSRLYLSNRASSDSSRSDPSAAFLTELKGTKLREEVTFDDTRNEERASTRWYHAKDSWWHWYDSSRGTETVVQNGEGDLASFRTPNRYTPEYREMRYAQLQSLESSLKKKWGSLLHTCMITLTCSTTTDAGNPRPPVDHLLDLLSSWESVRRELSRVLDGREWERVAILEPHKSGYAHVHLGVFVKGPVKAERFESVVDAHVKNSEGAGREAHEVNPDDPDEDGVVSVHRTARNQQEDGLQNLGAYLASYIGGDYGTEATEQPEYVQRFYTLMWATGKQSFRPSNGAQQYMKPEDDDDDEEEPEDWELVGLAPDGDLESIHEIDPEADRRSIWTETGDLFDVMDPPDMSIFPDDG